MTKKIIAISGKQFSGKDTVAEKLKEYLLDFELAPLAKAIKEELGEAKKLTLKEIDRNKFLYRAELMELGNKKRAEEKDYWIKKVVLKDQNIIIPDMRMKHELEIFKDMDAISIRINASRKEREKRGHLIKEDDPTETELDEEKNWDYIIENNGSLKELKEKAEEIAKELKEKVCSVK